jgi:cob(I)alamin adenosyltransferase
VDEASAVIGLARVHAQDELVRGYLLAVQRDLHRLMADLATVPESAPKSPWLAVERVDWLDEVTTRLESEVEMPRAFIIPGDSLGGATLEVARTVVRRAERLVARLAHRDELRDDTPLRYLNRLSSLIFVLARMEDLAEGVKHFTLASEGE